MVVALTVVALTVVLLVAPRSRPVQVYIDEHHPRMIDVRTNARRQFPVGKARMGRHCFMCCRKCDIFREGLESWFTEFGAGVTLCVSIRAPPPWPMPWLAVACGRPRVPCKPPVSPHHAPHPHGRHGVATSVPRTQPRALRVCTACGLRRALAALRPRAIARVRARVQGFPARIVR